MHSRADEHARVIPIEDVPDKNLCTFTISYIGRTCARGGEATERSEKRGTWFAFIGRISRLTRAEDAHRIAPTNVCLPCRKSDVLAYA